MEDLEVIVKTEQQETSLNHYYKDRENVEFMIAIEDFKNWYDHYCLENGLVNDGELLD